MRRQHQDIYGQLEENNILIYVRMGLTCATNLYQSQSRQPSLEIKYLRKHKTRVSGGDFCNGTALGSGHYSQPVIQRFLLIHGFYILRPRAYDTHTIQECFGNIYWQEEIIILRQQSYQVQISIDIENCQQQFWQVPAYNNARS